MPRIKNISASKLPATFDALVQLMPPSAIHDEVGYGNTMKIVEALTSLPKLTKGQSQYLDTLSILVEAYEVEHDAIDTKGVSPLDVLKMLLEEHGMNASDLDRLLGERSLGPKMLNGDRELSKEHIRRLVDALGSGPGCLFSRCVAA